MVYVKLPFQGTLLFAVKLTQWTGCIARISGSLHECVSVGWKEGQRDGDVIGNVLFTPVAEQGRYPTFPEDLLEQLLASSP